MLPFAARWRAVKRKLVPYRASINPYALEHGFRQLAMLDRAGIQIRDRTVLEIGSGWQPVIPLLFHLAGRGQPGYE